MCVCLCVRVFVYVSVCVCESICPLTIKRLVFKINEIGFDDMRGMKTQILSSNSKYGDYIPINSFNDNYGFVYGDALLKYIKIKILIPENKPSTAMINFPNLGLKMIVNI